MQVNKYLVVKKTSQWKASARITDKKPFLHPDEVSIYLTLNIPDALFQRPALKAEIKIDDNVVPSQISADIINNIKEVVSESLGMTLEITNITQGG